MAGFVLFFKPSRKETELAGGLHSALGSPTTPSEHLRVGTAIPVLCPSHHSGLAVLGYAERRVPAGPLSSSASEPFPGWLHRHLKGQSPDPDIAFALSANTAGSRQLSTDCGNALALFPLTAARGRTNSLPRAYVYFPLVLAINYIYCTNGSYSSHLQTPARPQTANRAYLAFQGTGHTSLIERVLFAQKVSGSSPAMQRSLVGKAGPSHSLKS